MTTDLVLVKIDAARTFLAAAKSLSQVKEVIALADAAAVYARCLDASVETLNYAAEIRILAERRLGEMLAQMPKNAGTAGNGRPILGGTILEPPKRITPSEESDTMVSPPTLADLGISKKESQRCQDIAAIPEEELQELLHVEPGQELNPNRVAKIARERRQRRERQAQRLQAAAGCTLDERIIVGDFRQHADRVADGSVSLIFTDPPYDQDAAWSLPALGKFAAAKLAEGGSLLCYVGQTKLPAALNSLQLYLRYWWAVACIHTGGATFMHEYGIKNGWKAVLWFVKGTRDDTSVMVSDVMSGGREKTHHDWQQAESEAQYWIEKLCPEDGLVCDPYLGSGTTGAAAQAVGRQWIGFEINPDTAAIASRRLRG